MSQNTSQKPIQRILIILSGLAFAGSSVIGIAELYTRSSPEPKSSSTTVAPSKDAKLKEQERGYELVVQREPNNQIALQGLVQTRLQMNNLKGAVEPMEKLVRLNPDNSQYKALLAGVKQRVDQGK